MTKILLTGGTGTFGKEFVEKILGQREFSTISLNIFSRDEMKQWYMRESLIEQFGSIVDERVNFVLGDVREKTDIEVACHNCDMIVHAAATKIVPSSEKNPKQCIMTNVMGAINICEVARNSGVKRLVALSTDKACSPVNLYGASKLASDKIILNESKLRLSNIETVVVRYGNVIASRGSVIPFFKKLITENKKIPITHKDMSRFLISAKSAVEFVLFALLKKEMFIDGMLLIPKLPSCKIYDLALALGATENQIYISGIRSGEKLHEELISNEDPSLVFEFNEYFVVADGVTRAGELNARAVGAVDIKQLFKYSSNGEDSLLSFQELRSFLQRVSNDKPEKSGS